MPILALADSVAVLAREDSMAAAVRRALGEGLRRCEGLVRVSTIMGIADGAWQEPCWAPRSCATLSAPRRLSLRRHLYMRRLYMRRLYMRRRQLSSRRRP